MPVSIGEVTSEFVVDHSASAGTGSTTGAVQAPAPEVQKEELRAIVRELLLEELERYLRLAVDR